MISASQELIKEMTSSVRHVVGKVELYEGSTLLQTFRHIDILKSIKIERVGDETKFFGYSMCQKVNVHLIDTNRELEPTTANHMKVYFNDTTSFPSFYITEVHRDEKTNELSITGYDKLYKATGRTILELYQFMDGMSGNTSYDLEGFVSAAALLLDLNGYDIQRVANKDVCFKTFYEYGANFNGTESIRDGLNGIAEATQTICYISGDDKLIFKRLNEEDSADLTIERPHYFELESGTNRRLGSIVHLTDMGDNLTASINETGSTQYMRNNPFWTATLDAEELIGEAINQVGGLCINQFECEWRGNFLLEVGDKIALITRDGDTRYSYLLDDVVEYTGGYMQKTQWHYTQDEGDYTMSAATTIPAVVPLTLGDSMKYTSAKVDKVDKEISLIASEVKETSAELSSLKMNTGSVEAIVQGIDAKITDNLEAMTQEVEFITDKLQTVITKDELAIEISNELQNGVDKVRTSTGFTFDDNGLKIEKSDREMTTQITEDGMVVYRSGEAVLEADNEGVKATNLHATTYLIIGNNSRFEDYDTNRTACFWIRK